MKFKPTCPWIVKEQRAQRQALSRWYLLNGAKGDPWPPPTALPFSPAAKKARQKHNDLVLYAAALGQKQGRLPEMMTGWQGHASWNGDVGNVTFVSVNESGTPAVVIPVRFLEWSPTAEAEPMLEAA